MQRMLLHTCCGPCASAVLPYWVREGLEVGGFFFNPNIHPFQEWKLRAAGASEVAQRLGAELSIDRHYDPGAWFAYVRGGDSRCFLCLRQRLCRTAEEAARRGFSSFSTTLVVSPYQDHEAIRQAGNEAAQLHAVTFVYSDLRSLYPESRKRSREWGIYRQKYCGCLMSEWERFRESRADR